MTALPAPENIGIVACGAIARELQQVVAASGLDHIEVRYLPAKLHNTPSKIPGAVRTALSELAPKCDRLMVGYGDCGTGGQLDKVLEDFDATRLNGSHCYQFFAGFQRFDELHDAEPGTFYLTDYLARQFETLVYKPLGLDRHPELRDTYFGNYTRLLYLAQSDDPALDARARDAAERLGLRFERIETGFGDLGTFLKDKAA